MHSIFLSDLSILGASVTCLGMKTVVIAEEGTVMEVEAEVGMVVAVVDAMEVETALEVEVVVGEVMEAAAAVMEEVVAA